MKPPVCNHNCLIAWGVCTDCGKALNKETDEPQRTRAMARAVGDPQPLRNSIDAVLRRLGVSQEQIDEYARRQECDGEER